MKKMTIILSLICGIMLTCGVEIYAQSNTTEDEYADMTAMRKTLVRMKQEMDAFIKEIATTYTDPTLTTGALPGDDVKVDMAENDKEYILKADLPGMSKDRIDVTLENERIVRISGTRETMVKEEKPGMVRQERSFGSFERILQLPGDGDAANIRAGYKDGVLEITIPKKIKAEESKVKVRIQ